VTDAQTEGAEALTPKQLALMLKSDARTVRKFLRGQFGKVGQGNRWGLEVEDLDAFTVAWLAWRDKIDARKLSNGVAEIVEAAAEGEDEMEVE
jgi:hypothetical protein